MDPGITAKGVGKSQQNTTPCNASVRSTSH